MPDASRFPPGVSDFEATYACEQRDIEAARAAELRAQDSSVENARGSRQERDSKAANLGSATEPGVHTDDTDVDRPAGHHIECAESREPYVARTCRDRVGLALSGGGIRSASFGLGLLQALAQYRVLDAVDYLSTVSGGGYVGAFWTTWKRWSARCKDEPRHAGAASTFPLSDACDAPAHGLVSTKEPRVVRHLREHSRFLAPRTGAVHVDSWEAGLAILGGAIPTLVVAISLVAMLLLLWRVVILAVIQGGFAQKGVPPFAICGIAIAVVAVLSAFERPWQTRSGWHVLRTIIVAVVTALIVVGIAVSCDVALDSVLARREISRMTLDPDGLLTSIKSSTAGRIPLVAEYAPAIVVGIAAVLLTMLRWLLEAGRRLRFAQRRENDPTSVRRTVGRAAARLFAFAFLFAVLASVWASTVPLTDDALQTNVLESLGITGGLFGVLTFAFGKARHLLHRSREEDETGIGARLRPHLPRGLAIAMVLLLFAFVALGCRAIAGALSDANDPWLAMVAAPAMLCLFIGVERVGLRDFYRRRLAQAFVLLPGQEAFDADWLCGGIGEAAGPNCASAIVTRPVHLVCCAANEVGGDPLPTLYRGARSAVLSRHGVTIGDRTRKVSLRLSDAITASAAAFNSQMGGASLRLGRSVSFLMSALNLRLGLWLRGPGERRTRWLVLPGLRLFAEMAGATKADAKAGWVHLSDGGHFENLGLYELVRRHCRYVIVADCGADPKVRFDDLADAIRRVREDFGVEIDIDLSQIRVDDDGMSRRHVAVGTIYYDGRLGNDRGTLVLVKPSLVGDEPPDVVQYRDRNSAFPHESTGDQFFDEPQFESYRRLGEHCGRTIFHCVKDLENRTPNELFAAVADTWKTTPRP